MKYTIIVIGTSAGGVSALKLLLGGLSNPNRLPILILQHMSPKGDNYLPEIIQKVTGSRVYEAGDKMPIESGIIYTPAPNYHMLMEKDYTLSLTVEERVCYARPSIDVLFESVADTCKEKTIGIILTGANTDGANGLLAVASHGGYTMVEEPSTAYATAMPSAAIKLVGPDFIGNVEAIKQQLESLII